MNALLSFLNYVVTITLGCTCLLSAGNAMTSHNWLVFTLSIYGLIASFCIYMMLYDVIRRRTRRRGGASTPR